MLSGMIVLIAAERIRKIQVSFCKELFPHPFANSW